MNEQYQRLKNRILQVSEPQVQALLEDIRQLHDPAFLRWVLQGIGANGTISHGSCAKDAPLANLNNGANPAAFYVVLTLLGGAPNDVKEAYFSLDLQGTGLKRLPAELARSTIEDITLDVMSKKEIEEAIPSLVQLPNLAVLSLNGRQERVPTAIRQLQALLPSKADTDGSLTMNNFTWQIEPSDMLEYTYRAGYRAESPYQMSARFLAASVGGMVGTDFVDAWDKLYDANEPPGYEFIRSRFEDRYGSYDEWAETAELTQLVVYNQSGDILALIHANDSFDDGVVLLPRQEMIEQTSRMYTKEGMQNYIPLSKPAQNPAPKQKVTKAKKAPAKVDLSPLYKLTVRSIDGRKRTLSKYVGKVMIIVNTASRCGGSSQLKQLESMYQRHKKAGLVVLAFPSNDFGDQEPGKNKEIKQVYAEEFGVTYPLFAKTSLADNPLFAYLTTKGPERLRGAPGWNYTKFVVDAQGQIVYRFGPREQPPSFEEKVIALLQ